MKAMILILSLILGSSAFAKTYTVKNEEAQRLVEAVLCLPSTFYSVGTNAKRLVTSGAMNCTFGKNEDGIEGGVNCYAPLNPLTSTYPRFVCGDLAFYQAIRKYAKPSMIIGLLTIAVDQIQCDMRVQPRKYTCTITVN